MTTRERSYLVGGLGEPKGDEEQRKGQWNTRFPCFWPQSSRDAAASVQKRSVRAHCQFQR